MPANHLPTGISIIEDNNKCGGAGGEAPVNDANEKSEKAESWNAVALGLNRLITAIYLVGNVLAFAFYMFPLLQRIILDRNVEGYVVDTK